jgi:uncharacterized protein YqfA (UPF0365 family)
VDLTQVALLSVGALLGLQFFFFLFPIPLWVGARLSGVSVGLLDLFVMRFFQRIPPQKIVVPAITAGYAGIPLEVRQLQTHYMSGGDVAKVVAALVAASKAKLELTWNTATCIDLAGRDILEAVQMSVNPKVIKSPPIEAVSQDGIKVKVVCLITVRANIAQLVGSAGAETVLARVGEGIVTAIGSSASFSSVLENPNLITQAVLKTKLDLGTAYEILSIDIADIEVGENIGARLQIDQAEADKLVAQAKAEERLSEARATHAEMSALIQQMHCKVVESRAEIPEALFDALSAGNLSVMQYYEMENLKADTCLRETVGEM